MVPKSHPRLARYVLAVLVVFCLYSVAFYSLTYYANSQGMSATAFTGSVDNADSGEYLILGHTLLETGHYTGTFRTPGYPFFIAILVGIFGSDMAVQFAQLFLVGFSAVFIYLLGRRFGYPWVGLAAAALYVLNPLVFLYSVMSMAETLFTTIFLGATVLLTTEKASKWHMFAGGLLMGAATLVRPMGLYFVPVLMLWLVLTHWKQWRTVLYTASLVLLGVALIVVPWMVRNQVQNGSFALSTIGPYDLLLYNIPTFLQQWEGIAADETRAEMYTILGLTGREEDDAWLMSYDAMGKIRTLAYGYIIASPVQYGLYHISSTASFFFGSDIGAVESLLHRYGLISAPPESVNNSYLLLRGQWREFLRSMLSELPQLIERLAWLTLLMSAIVLVAYMASTRSREALLALLFLALIFANAILIGPVSEPRFRLNVAPFIFILGFTGIHLAFMYLKKKIRSS